TTGPEGVIHVLDEHDDRLLTLRTSVTPPQRTEQRIPAGPLRMIRTRRALFVMSLLAHEIRAYAIDEQGVPGPMAGAATIDGPYWGFDVLEDGEDALIVAGGAEDRPLDRRGGFFGWIDSF